MVKEKKKTRKITDVRNTNQEDYDVIRAGTQNYLGNAVAIPRNSFWFKDEKKIKEKEPADLKKVAKADDFAIREILSDNDTALSKENFSGNKNFLRPVTAPVKRERTKKGKFDATAQTVTKQKKIRTRQPRKIKTPKVL